MGLLELLSILFEETTGASGSVTPPESRYKDVYLCESNRPDSPDDDPMGYRDDEGFPWDD